ncbi:MAG: cyclodeaminase/cyclohydrolase family protein [Lachnospiraceae bacterium]|nr:cyclodeaminase/cyclohydrolase family protein [Lachnospiraceae bacterium]
MKLTDMTVNGFTALLGSEAPAPGGGSAAALAGALGAALTAMVASLTYTKAKYAEYHEMAHEVFDKASDLQNKLLTAIDEDTEAFNKIGEAFALPKSTDEEKKARSAAIQDALVLCTESPLTIMKLSADALKLTQQLIGRSNGSAASDLGVSALMIRSALLGGWLNVLINISSIKDAEKANAYKDAGEAILAEAIPMADKIYAIIEDSL